MKKIISIFRKILIGGLILYTFNMFSVSYDTIIPMNVFTISYISCLGLPALFSLILIQRIIY
jgi:pro-sigmaK processing inhibitor BofA